jgi:4-amino-4-deoxy-L-arabinose transferase-like glycosyltransferase
LLAALLALLLWAAQFALTFRGLESSDAFSYAQIARNIARGEGIVTQESMPYELLRFKDVPHPELMHPPLTALAESVLFRIFGPQDWAATLPGAASYVLTAALVYLAACRWAGARAGPGAGALGAAIFLTHPGSAHYATSGLAESLYGFLITGSVVLIAASRDRVRWPLVLLTGAALGLTDLARETARYLLPVAAVLLWGEKPGRWSRLGALAAGYLLVTFPNYIRIAAATGSPFVSYGPSILMSDIPPFHGLKWYRSMSSIDPLSYLSQAPQLLARKVAFNALFLGATFAQMLSPVLVIGALAAWRWASHPEARRAAILTCAALLLQTLVSLLFLIDLRHFAPFLPLLAALSAAATLGLWPHLGRWGRMVMVVALVSVLLGQSRDQIRNFLPRSADYLARRAEERAAGEFVAQRTGPEDLVVTDVSEIVAWYADRRSVWFPLDESLLDQLPERSGAKQYLFLTSFRIAPEPMASPFGVQPPEPWARYLVGSTAPPGFEPAGELRIRELQARLFRRSETPVAGRGTSR